MAEPIHFDEFAIDYDIVLAQGLSVTGEEKGYFACGRVAWLAQLLRKMGEHPQHVMDYGCGTGSTTKLLLDSIEPESVLGVDNSAKSIELARSTFNSEKINFLLLGERRPPELVDLVYCNGVFHHINPNDRAAALEFVWSCLRPGGLFALWENNPWNPGTRFVMSRTPFDRDAIPLSPLQAQKLVRSRFDILRSDYLFIFPRVLKWLRPFERLVSRMPVGGQFQILCRKTVGSPRG
jgi:SAM-dependent methyltransferase